MKKSYILNIVLAIAVVVLCLYIIFQGGKRGGDNMENQVLKNIAERSSVRLYQEKPVEKDKIEKLLRAAMAAPSAVNKQPWHFIVVTDKAQLKRLASSCPNASMAEDAPLAIVVCGDMKKALSGEEQGFWIQDASAATENILLAAQGMGLGAVWTGTYPMMDRLEKVREILELPEDIIPLNTIVIGYPAEEPRAKDKFDSKNISYNFFGKNEGETSPSKEEVKKKEFLEFNLMDDFRENPFRLFSGMGVLLASGNKTSFNAMTISWGSLGTLWGHSSVTVYVAKGRYTHEFMEKDDYFTLMKFNDNDVLEYMGTHSGRDGDKAKALGLHTLYTENGTPYFEEAQMVIECRVMYGAPFDSTYFRSDVPKEFYENKADAGLHSIYIGEIINAIKK